MWVIAIFIFSFGLAFAAPPGTRAEGKIGSDELVIRLVLHVQKTETGTKLVVNLEESPQTEIRPSAKPLLSVETDFPKRNETPKPIDSTFFRIKSAAVIENRPKPNLDFKISLGMTTKKPTTVKPEISTTEVVPTTAAILEQYPIKAVADQGFGVLASRCATYAPGLVSDGAGGCTKPANRIKKKHVHVPERWR